LSLNGSARRKEPGRSPDFRIDFQLDDLVGEPRLILDFSLGFRLIIFGNTFQRDFIPVGFKLAQCFVKVVFSIANV